MRIFINAIAALRHYFMITAMTAADETLPEIQIKFKTADQATRFLMNFRMQITVPVFDLMVNVKTVGGLPDIPLNGQPFELHGIKIRITAPSP